MTLPLLTVMAMTMVFPGGVHNPVTIFPSARLILLPHPSPLLSASAGAGGVVPGLALFFFPTLYTHVLYTYQHHVYADSLFFYILELLAMYVRIQSSCLG